MKELKKEDIKQEVFDLYDAYAHNKLDRRTFVEKLSTYAVGGITVASLMSAMMPNYVDTKTILPDDERLESEYITYNSPKGGGEIKGLLSTPTGMSGKVPGIVVVHENRGLNPYIEDVGKRCAVAGFISLAPDALTPLGGYPGNDDDGRAMQSKRDRNEMLEDFIAAYETLKNHPNCTGEVGVVGFCFGGWISNMMAVRIPDLGAAVPFYGGQPSAEETAKINAPLMLQYAGLDERVNAGWPAYEEALKANNVEYQAYVYPDVNHGFHNNTTSRYDEAAATLAWERTISFFKEHLKG
ncbi:dienelactone hydrolase family protein [Algoriphagus machipongonensis]|uniref:Dienelactone hydrolase family protein n=1 Tax=Algoriphagus machipongonensis TaxID=388413 RepID=A3I0W4_9BACT|nr:dienelactone hydrolase family protein [Algoriphagus machipongonensis]EAZ80110.1 dienelactone hydrolase family protein [Algoriphagus machipongonensis]